MTELVWDAPLQRRYEAGVSHGVLYPTAGPGVVWNGLISVDETPLKEASQPLYFDGIKYLDLVGTVDYQAKLKAFSAPAEFGPCIGEYSNRPGFILTRQAMRPFGFSYRTEISTIGYKIHIVYNASATLTARSHGSLTEQTPLANIEATINAIPVDSVTHRPSPHFVLDSTKMDAGHISAVESILYGDPTHEPSLPDLSTLIALLD